MGEILEDYRTKLSRQAHCVLIARSRATGESQQEIGRRLIEAWAEGEIHASKVLANLLRDEGMGGEGGGNA